MITSTAELKIFIKLTLTCYFRYLKMLKLNRNY